MLPLPSSCAIDVFLGMSAVPFLMKSNGIRQPAADQIELVLRRQ
jgi:hypothetical protein